MSTKGIIFRTRSICGIACGGPWRGLTDICSNISFILRWNCETIGRRRASIAAIVCWRMKRVPRGFEGIIRAALFLMGACSLWHGCVEAQEFRSTLRVEVRDSSGAAIAAAQVVLADKDSGLRIAQNADSAGEIQLQGILPGTYALTVTAAGFAAHTQSVVVAISAHAAVRAVLTPETLQQSVEV